MGLMPIFYDTFAVLGYLSGNTRYAGYFEEDYGFLTILNLMETYYALLKGYDEGAVKGVYSACSRFKYEFEERDVKDAMKLKLRSQGGRSISYADASGYHISMKLGVRFLPGDKAFEHLQNVKHIR
jgi:hypothetical protein